MGYRFRKSVKLGPFRINFSRSGVGYSVGGKGCRVTKRADGRTQTTVSIPGTGISHVSTSGGSKSRSHSPQQPEKKPVKRNGMGCMGWALAPFVAAIPGIWLGSLADTPVFFWIFFFVAGAFLGTRLLDDAYDAVKKKFSKEQPEPQKVVTETKPES